MDFQVSSQDAAQRLDLFLVDHCPALSRSRIQALIREKVVRVNGKPTRSSYSIRPGDRVELDAPDPVPLKVEPESLPLNILFEDGDLLVVDKVAGMTVHPAPGSRSGTLVNALLAHCRDLSGINGVLRPGIVHRLDKETSGLLVVAKNDLAHRHLAAQLRARRMQRRYTALVWGHPEAEGRIEAPIARHPRDRKRMAVVEGGRGAATRFAVVERFAFLSLLDLQLETGRTHQIRVHMQHVGYPVFGDPVYGGRHRIGGLRPEYRRQAESMLDMIDRQALHARELRFAHPRTGEEMAFASGLPGDMARVMAAAGH
jgi:23S rRNA pseudouridine1911/1915/1917 synthase